MVFFGECEVDFDPHPEPKLLCSVKEKRHVNKILYMVGVDEMCGD